MKMFLPLACLLITLAKVPIYGKDKNSDTIEKIEEMYNQIQANSPSIMARGRVVTKAIRFIQPEDKVIADYSKLKQIALVRHGEPDMELNGDYTSEGANQYLQCYDSVCIIVPDAPFFEMEEGEEVKVFSSPINRALTTAHYIFGTDKEITTSPVFREFENKIGPSHPGKKKSMKFWRRTNRIKWMLGGGKKKGIESFKEAKERSKNAAQMLADASATDPKVLLTAHGFLNRYIKKNLKKMGWKVVEETGNNYFGTTILVKID